MSTEESRLSKFAWLIPEVILGYIILVVFLCVLGTISPSIYQKMTQWAKQDYLPEMDSCLVTSVKEDKQYRWYNVDIYLNSKGYSSFKKLGVVVDPPNCSVYIDEHLTVGSQPKSYDSPHYLFLRNISIRSKKISFAAVVVNDNNDILKQYDGKNLPQEECPFSINIYGSR